MRVTFVETFGSYEAGCTYAVEMALAIELISKGKAKASQDESTRGKDAPALCRKVMKRSQVELKGGL